MSEWRADVVDAVSRMRVTFGARTAARNLPDCLDPGEVVRELVACTYAGGDGVLVLTDRRVLAVRDDHARYRAQGVSLAEVYAVDYAPRVHDGLGVLTPAGRIAVRRMNREDSDRFVAALVAAHPHVVVGASRPRPPAAHAPAPARVRTVQPAAPAASAPAAAPAAPPAPAPVAPAAAPEPEPAPDESRLTVDAPTPDAQGAPPQPVADAVLEAAQADTEVLLGVLADLHAKGLLTADELATKVAQLTARA